MIDYDKALLRLLFIPFVEYFNITEKIDSEDYDSEDLDELLEMQFEYEERSKKNIKKILILLKIEKE